MCAAARMSEKVRQPPVSCRSVVSSSAISASISCKSRSILSLPTRAAAAEWVGEPAVTSTRKPYAARRRFRARGPGRRPKAGAPRDRLVGEDAAAAVAVEGIAPERLNRECPAVAQRDIGRCSLAGADPGALVAVLLTAPIEPAPVRELIGDRLGQLVPLDDRDSGVRAEPVEVRPARRARIRDVRQVRVSDVAVRGRGRTVPGAVLRPEAGGAVVVRGRDYVLHR